MTKYLILGAGFIGTHVHNFLSNSTLSKDRIKSYSDIVELIRKYNPDVVINCIGKTGRPNVDWCETNINETFQGNIIIPTKIAMACKSLGKYMVHIGSGCIYSGSNNGRGFKETDVPNFQGSLYSRSKVICEKILLEFPILQLRIRMPLDSKPSGRNLLDKLLSYEKIVKCNNSITVIDDFLPVLEKLMTMREVGVFNIVNKGFISNKKILDLYSEISGKKLSFSLISEDDLGKLTLARRSNCLLSIKKLESTGLSMPKIEVSAYRAIKNYCST